MLSLSLFCLSHLDAASISCCITVVILDNILPDFWTMVSSANIDISWIPMGKSFINSKNRRGPKIDPCGTPDLTDEKFDSLL